VSRVTAVILHPGAGPDPGPLAAAFAAIRLANAERQAAGFGRAGAAVEIAGDLVPGETFGGRVRSIASAVSADGLVLLGSGSIPLARSLDRRAFVAVAGGPAGHALANNRYSADVVAVAGTETLRAVPPIRADNGLPRWLAGAGIEVADLRRRWRLQVDLDSPLDALLTAPGPTERFLEAAGVPLTRLHAALAGVVGVAGDARRELLVAGRTSAAGLAWLERSTASRTRALIEERGFRTRPPEQRAVRSTLGLVLDRDGPDAIGARLAELADAAVVDTRVLLAHRFGADEAGWPRAEDRFASDLLLPDRIEDPWLRALTASAVGAPIPILLGGHSLGGPGLRLVFAPSRARRREASGEEPAWT
jgi:hypothetical protein